MAARRRHAVLPALGLIVLAATTAVLLDARPAGAAGHDSPSTPSGGLLGGLLGGSPTTDPQHDPIGDAPTGLLGGTVGTLGSTVTNLGQTVGHTVSGVTSTLPTVPAKLGGTVRATVRGVGSTVTTVLHGAAPKQRRSVTTTPPAPTRPVTPPATRTPPRTPPTAPPPTSRSSAPSHRLHLVLPRTPMRRVRWSAGPKARVQDTGRPTATTTPGPTVPRRTLTPATEHRVPHRSPKQLNPAPASGLGSSVAARHRFLTDDALNNALRPSSPVEILAMALVLLAAAVAAVVVLGGRRRPRSGTPRS